SKPNTSNPDTNKPDTNKPAEKPAATEHTTKITIETPNGKVLGTTSVIGEAGKEINPPTIPSGDKIVKIIVDGKVVSSVPTKVGDKNSHVVIVVEPKDGEGNTSGTQKPESKPNTSNPVIKTHNGVNKKALGNENGAANIIKNPSVNSNINNTSNINSDTQGISKVITNTVQQGATKITQLPDTGLSSAENTKANDLGAGLATILGLGALVGFLRKNKK
ncbi:MAG: hypothetical protein ACRC41_18210, partial [Sarcina sp.]